MKSIKEKNGFTLIELLVTIVLILSILSIATVSFVNISERQKKKAYENVEEQVVVAAKEFFSVNEYYKDNLINNNDYVTVSLGELVKEDYMNSVTDPTTGKKLNECSYIKLSKDDNGKLLYSFIKETDKCVTNSFIMVVQATNPGPIPNISYTIEGKIGNNGWYVLDNKGNSPVVNITAYDKESTLYPSIEILQDDGSYMALETEFDSNGNLIAKDDFSYANSVASKQTTYKVTNEIGNSKMVTTDPIKVDVDKPSCNIKVSGTSATIANSSTKYNYEYTLIRPSIKLSYSDNMSGMDSKEIRNPGGDYENYSILGIYKQGDTDGKSVLWSGKVTDKAGNVSNCFKYINVKKESILSGIDLTYHTCGRTEGESTTWTNKNVTITQYFDENNLITQETTNDISGWTTSKTFTQTTTVGEITKNSVSCDVGVYIDKDKPVYSDIEFDLSTIWCDNSNCDGIVTLKEWDSSGNLIQEDTVDLTYDIWEDKYIGDACLRIKNGKGKFSFYDYKIIAYDQTSGVKNYSSKSHQMWDKNGKDVTGHCYSTKKENPCIYEDRIYAYDKAGNKSDNLGKLRIRVGYVGKDSFCPSS